MQNWALMQAPGAPEERSQRPKRPRGAQGQPNPDTQKQMLLILSRLALKHDLEIRELQAATFRTMLMKHDEPSMQTSKAATGLFVSKSKEGQRLTGEPHVYGWAAIMTALTTDPALSSEDKQKVAAYTSSANSPETLLQSIYWSQFKKTFQKDWVKWQCSVDPQTQPLLCLIIKAMKARGAKEKFGQSGAYPTRSTGPVWRVAHPCSKTRGLSQESTFFLWKGGADAAVSLVSVVALGTKTKRGFSQCSLSLGSGARQCCDLLPQANLNLNLNHHLGCGPSCLSASQSQNGLTPFDRRVQFWLFFSRILHLCSAATAHTRLQQG